MMEESYVDSLLPAVTLAFAEWPVFVYPYWPYITVFFIIIFFSYVCFCANEGGIHYVTTERVPIIMRKVINPFTFDIIPQNADTPGDVSCTVSTKKTCYVLPFWGVPGSDLFEVLQLDWISMKHALMENHTSFKNKCLVSSPSIRINSGQKVLSFMPPSSLYEDENINQRLFLPLVIVMLLDEDTVESIEQPIIFVQAAIVHVPSIFKNTNISNGHNSESIPFNHTQRIPAVLGIYVKESHSPTIGVVKRVYDGSLYSENLNGEEVPVCVACCQRRVNTVIFPCLHASLCTWCYHQCEVCPSCRGPVYYYFTTGPIIEIPHESN